MRLLISTVIIIRLQLNKLNKKTLLNSININNVKKIFISFSNTNFFIIYKNIKTLFVIISNMYDYLNGLFNKYIHQ